MGNPHPIPLGILYSSARIPSPTIGKLIIVYMGLYNNQLGVPIGRG